VSATIGYLDGPATRSARAVARALGEALDGNLVGVYLYGSATLGDFVPGHSDLDLLTVCHRPLEPDEGRRVADAVWSTRLSRSAKGVDLHVVPLHSATTPHAVPAYDVQILTAFGMERFSCAGDDRESRLNMQYVCCRRHGYPLIGPDPRKVFAPRSRTWYLRELREELSRSRSWNPIYTVLNACRDWRFAEEHLICSKVAGGEWACERLEDPSIVDAALCWQREGAGPELPAADVDAFVAHVATILERAAGAA
jgi:hypothetical protein